MKRRDGLLATAALAMTALSPALVRAQEPTTTLRFSWWGGGNRHDATLKAIAAFEAKNPGVKIKAEYMGFQGYLERLSTQIAGGSEPDIMQVNWAWVSQFSKTGEGFLDLGKYRSLIALNQFADNDIKMGTVNGKLNALPVSYTARVFVWNRAAYERVGLAMPATWDDLLAAGPVFQKKVGDNGYAIDIDPYDTLLLAHSYVYQKFGTPYVNPSAPSVAMSEAALLEWIQAYKRFSSNHVGVPLPVRTGLGGAEKPTEQQQDWVVGNWAGNYTWDSVLGLRASTLDKNQKLDIGEFLTLPGARNSGIFGRPSLMFAGGKKTRNPEMVAKFMNFMTTDPEAGAILGLTRGVPSADSQFRALVKANTLQGIELKAHLQIKAKKDAGQIDLPSPLFEHARFQKFVREVFEAVAYGKVSDQEAARRLLDEGNSLLKRIK
ncbi:ABC transporter substrate-binding protein [Rhodoferax koreensis]|nr:ABC transporter substrate-binding protein [Rhodoferax koreense]